MSGAVKEEAVDSRGSSEQGEGEMEVDSNDEQDEESETKQGGNFSQSLSALSSLRPGLFCFLFCRIIRFMLYAVFRNLAYKHLAIHFFFKVRSQMQPSFTQRVNDGRWLGSLEETLH